MNYQVVFDSTQQSFPWWIFLVLLALAAMWLVAWFNRDKTPGLDWWRSLAQPFLIIVGASMLCLSLCGVCALISSFNSAQLIVSTGKDEVVEGPVQNLTDDGKIESFTVQGIRFSYGDADVGPGFHHTNMLGGPITHNGLQVRIHYGHVLDDSKLTILKLELAK